MQYLTFFHRYTNRKILYPFCSLLHIVRTIYSRTYDNKGCLQKFSLPQSMVISNKIAIIIGPTLKAVDNGGTIVPALNSCNDAYFKGTSPRLGTSSY